ncbi:DUF4245 domain-containing protein [Rhodococcus sp. ACPA4]|uniref:Uncharacterized protein DUF4245 n=1 Tax=Nocardia globerula TaxID=1818 RepID=A0A652YSG2_NOCGL|nr:MULTISPECIES: DUF4245 domain-containing protein [Rhodococcus]NMD61506.1 DUF4245 domain-containing protein [Nocardia globerula]NRI68979.1 DUF4245 domain-containing protein [Rhodococcus sp. MS16]MCE4264724.1 DUF4245 domain-containing protein [Rhodococcus globerulus]MDV8068901.1 DUF4245 domain-containing protein [Rhodococcus sp. IEGM 1366]PBC37933.1 DUF4245 domain-containing protein [Rhodococcus sp. ACPA4]
MASKKPRILEDNKDMVWSLVPLVLFCIIIAGIASQCTFSPGGPTQGPIPSVDIDAALNYDAKELGFPIRKPVVPEGWTPNSGSRKVITGDGGGDSSTVGFITTNGSYIQLTQSNAEEFPLVSYVAGGQRFATGVEDIDGHTWNVFGGEGVESIWVTDVDGVRLLITGAAPAEDFTTLARNAGQAEPIVP